MFILFFFRVIDYVHQRLAKSPGTLELSKWLEHNFASLKEIPRFLFFTLLTNQQRTELYATIITFTYIIHILNIDNVKF